MSNTRKDCVSVIERAMDIYREELDHAIRFELQRVAREDVAHLLEGFSELSDSDCRQALRRRYWRTASELCHTMDQTKISAEGVEETVRALYHLEKVGAITVNPNW